MMTKILMLCGYSAYQAQCIAPFVWGLLAALGVYVVGHVTGYVKGYVWEDEDGEID
jgi:hypothetical protein